MKKTFRILFALTLIFLNYSQVRADQFSCRQFDLEGVFLIREPNGNQVHWNGKKVYYFYKKVINFEHAPFMYRSNSMVEVKKENRSGGCALPSGHVYTSNGKEYKPISMRQMLDEKSLPKGNDHTMIYSVEGRCMMSVIVNNGYGQEHIVVGKVIEISGLGFTLVDSKDEKVVRFKAERVGDFNFSEERDTQTTIEAKGGCY